MTKKEIAKNFLSLAASGRVGEAYDTYVHPDFIHHNAYFAGDRESLQRGMEESAQLFPNKQLETLRILADGDLVVVHSKLILTDILQMSVVHIFRFENELIIEEWETSQQVLTDSPNVNGIF